MDVFIRIVTFTFVTFIYAYTFTCDVYRFLGKLKLKNEKKTKKAVQWLIFSVLLGLTLYVYVAHLLFFR